MRAESPMEHIAQGKRSDTLGDPTTNNIDAPWKGKSIKTWQNGYGVFSVSQSIVDKTLDYISNQAMHHKRFSFQDEYRQFLLSYGVEYDEAYVSKD